MWAANSSTPHRGAIVYTILMYEISNFWPNLKPGKENGDDGNDGNDGSTSDPQKDANDKLGDVL